VKKMAEQIKLKPCPFCGGEAELAYTTDNSHRPFVRCKSIALITPKCFACQYPWRHKTEKDAIEAWNRRAET
jgi:Lar family restriction alleviation protein